MLLGWQPLQVIGALRVPQHAAGDAVASATDGARAIHATRPSSPLAATIIIALSTPDVPQPTATIIIALSTTDVPHPAAHLALEPSVSFSAIAALLARRCMRHTAGTYQPRDAQRDRPLLRAR